MPGKYFDDLQVGEHISHAAGRTVTEMDNYLFSALTMNPQQLHVNEDYASKTEFGRCIINGIYTLGLVVGLTVTDLTQGTIVANLGYEQIVQPNPVFPGDTIYVETEVLEKRDSGSRPDCGVVRLRHSGRNQNGRVVLEVERVVLFNKRPSEE